MTGGHETFYFVKANPEYPDFFVSYSVNITAELFLPFNMYCTVGKLVQSGGSQDGWEVSQLNREQYFCHFDLFTVFQLLTCTSSGKSIDTTQKSALK